MDSIFGLIVVFFLVVGVIEKNSRKKKAGSSSRPERPMPTKADALKRQASAAVKAASSEAMKALAEEILAVKADAAEKKLSVIESALQENAAEGEALSGMPMGASVTDENGCIGGSLGEHTEEGESHAEHAEHIARRDAALAAEHSIAADAAKLRNANRDELRRAIVMAEILDKPVALRRR